MDRVELIMAIGYAAAAQKKVSLWLSKQASKHCFLLIIKSVLSFAAIGICLGMVPG
jgi:hypothetical protein